MSVVTRLKTEAYKAIVIILLLVLSALATAGLNRNVMTEEAAKQAHEVIEQKHEDDMYDLDGDVKHIRKRVDALYNHLIKDSDG